MSCVVGLVRDGRVWMGADSAATSPNQAQFILKSPKVFVRGGRLFGPTGSIRLMQLLRFKNFEGLRSDDPEVVAELVAEQIRLLTQEDEGLLNNERQMEAKVLLGCAGRLFIIQEDFGVMEPRQNYTALGEGGPFALGAMSVLVRSDKDPETTLREALGISAQHCATVRPPFVIECL